MSLTISRRALLRSTALRAGVGVTGIGLSLQPAIAAARELKISRTTQTSSVCPYCAVGCSVVIHTLGDKARNVQPTVVHIEGDPDSPINRGTLCSKGISLKEFVVNDRRLTKPLHRAPGASDWKEISWDQAIDKAARHIKDTRDRTFQEKDAQGRTVNRTASIAMIGGCTDTNEINYLLSKFRFGLGIISYENQSRL